jgi:uncharacterized membrane protein
MAYPDWLWIPITLWAAFAQTLRNATQRGLTSRLGTLGLEELIFSYVVSLKLFREKLSAKELGGMALIALGIVIVTLGR